MNQHPLRFLLAAACLLLSAVPAFAQDDGFSESVIAYNLRDISASGTELLLGDDEVSAAVPLGFTFNFYGVDYTSVYVSSNGFITFSPGQSSGCCTGEPIPDFSPPNNFIAGFWEDLDPDEGVGNVRYETLGAEPNREFVVGYYDVEHWPGGTAVTFEIILHEGSNNVELQYADASSDSGFHSVGAEDVSGFFGYQVAYGNLTIENFAFLLTPIPFGVEPVPTMSGIAIALMVLLLGLVGFRHYRRARFAA